MMLFNRQAQELTNSNYGINRMITTLVNCTTFNAKQLTDILVNQRQVGKDLYTHDVLITAFLSTIIKSKKIITRSNTNKMEEFMGLVEKSEKLSQNLRASIELAAETINKKNITITQLSQATPGKLFTAASLVK